MAEPIFNPNQRLTRKQKNKDDKQWYKDQLRNLDMSSFSNNGMFGLTENTHGISEYRRMKVNYDLFNNIINKADFEHICSPFGKELGKLPADFTNKDIISGKVKALLGMEMKRPFSWKVVAVNEEATTRREQAEFGKIKDFVISSIMTPIRVEIEQQLAEQAKNRNLSEEELTQLQSQIEDQLQAMTPPEVKRYMERDHQDPAEALSHQILEYLIQKEDIKMKFNKAWKHGLIAGKEIFWVGVVNGEPTLKVINPLRFDYDKSPEVDYIEDGEWACYEMYMTPSDIVKHFGNELSKTEIDEIFEDYGHAESLPDSSFTFRNDGVVSTTGIRVLHGEWKSLKLVKFVSGKDPFTGEPYEDMVDEGYTLQPAIGDEKLTEDWIIAKYEGYQIGRDKFAYLREVPGQYKDLANLNNCKLSYVGATYDNLNSETTSLVDRMKYYQYMFNIVIYRVELLTASDKGKKLFMNLNMIPKKNGITLEKWAHYMDASHIGFLDPSEEGNKGNPDITSNVKEIDLSLASDIQKYILLADYLERRCGESVGITKQIEGQIGADEAVRNTQQALVQSANILEPYFELHNNIKRNVLQALIECAKVAYAEFQPPCLTYVLDDMSKKMINMDYDLLENSTYGIFVSNSMKSNEALQMVEQLSHAALQNQRVELSDVVKIMRSESVQEAEEMLLTAEKQRIEREQAIEQQRLQQEAQLAQKAREWEKERLEIEHRNNMEEITLKGELDIQKQTILSLGFNEDKDLDKDGMPDILEVAKFNTDADIKARQLDLAEKQFEEDKRNNTKKAEQKDKEIKIKQQQGNKVIKK